MRIGSANMANGSRRTARGRNNLEFINIARVLIQPPRGLARHERDLQRIVRLFGQGIERRPGAQPDGIQTSRPRALQPGFPQVVVILVAPGHPRHPLAVRPNRGFEFTLGRIRQPLRRATRHRHPNPAQVAKHDRLSIRRRMKPPQMLARYRSFWNLVFHLVQRPQFALHVAGKRYRHIRIFR